MRPLLFLRRLGCRTDGWLRMTTAECRGFKPATGDGFAIHPYSGRIGARAARIRTPTTSAWRRSAPCRRRSTGSSARAPCDSTTRRFGIFIDEYGYQTSPPDRIAGIKPQTQDAWLQRAAYLAWRTPRIKLFTQYLWRDEPRSANGTLQRLAVRPALHAAAAPSRASRTSTRRSRSTPREPPAVGPGAARRRRTR